MFKWLGKFFITRDIWDQAELDRKRIYTRACKLLYEIDYTEFSYRIPKGTFDGTRDKIEEVMVGLSEPYKH